MKTTISLNFFDFNFDFVFSDGLSIQCAFNANFNLKNTNEPISNNSINRIKKPSKF